MWVSGGYSMRKFFKRGEFSQMYIFISVRLFLGLGDYSI